MDGRPRVTHVLMRPEEEMIERPYITIALPTRPNVIKASYALQDGELLEAIDDLTDGTPDWSSAGICDTVRGDDPELQHMVRALLEHIATDDALCNEDDDLCNADYTTAGHDPYSTSCHIRRDVVHTVHEGRDPFGGDGLVRWEGGGSCAGDPLPYHNVVWEWRPPRVPRDEATRLSQLEEGELPMSEPEGDWSGEIVPNAGSAS